jgi:hypothetical protein
MTKNKDVRVRTNVKAGHEGNQHGLRVRTKVKAGHDGNQHGLRVR